MVFSPELLYFFSFIYIWIEYSSQILCSLTGMSENYLYILVLVPI